MNRLSKAAPLLAALTFTPGCEKTSTTIPVDHDQSPVECSLEAGSKFALQNGRSHEEGAIWRYHPDGFGPTIEQAETAEGIDVFWVKHPENPGDPSGIVVKVRGKVAYTLDPPNNGESLCGVATPNQEYAHPVECPPHSDRTHEQRAAANAAYYDCLGVDVFGNPTQ